MKYAHQCLVTKVSLIAIGVMLTVPLPAGAAEVVKIGGIEHLVNELVAREMRSNVWLHDFDWRKRAAFPYKKSTGTHNTAYGVSTLLSNTEGNHNTASGAYVLSRNKKGNRNTAVGSAALELNTEGSYNTAVGSNALRRNKKGNHNTASGFEVLSFNTDGKYNTASGYHALWKNQKGSSNTANGAGALRDNILGSHNTAIGFRAGAKNTMGKRNVFIGYEAGYLNDYRNKSDRLVIANGRHLKNHLILGNFKKQTVFIRGHLSAASFTETSDGRLKKDIQPLTHALDAILQLEGKTYRWKEDTTFANKADIGLVAQEVEKIFPELVAENEQGYKGIAYSKLTAVLIEAMKEQQGQMIAQQQQMTAQQDQIATLEKENTQLKAIMAEQMDALLARVAMLEGESLAAN